MADAAPGPGRLAGRGQELAALRQWLAEALAGHGRLVVLTGPPGIGKTRLAEELADGARRSGQRVLWGRAVEEQGAPPLWPWRRILSAVGGVDESARLIGSGVADSARSDDLAAARFRAAAAAAYALTAAAGAADRPIMRRCSCSASSRPSCPGRVCSCWLPAGTPLLIRGGPRWETWPGCPACKCFGWRR